MEQPLPGPPKGGAFSLSVMAPPGRRAEYAEMTRRALVDAARTLFAERGFAATSIDDVAEAARVTKGAVYHHFKGKTDLFEAVCERLEVDIVAAIAHGPSGGEHDPWDSLLRGIDRYLDECLEPDVQRILLMEAPTVLGWDRWKDLQGRFGLGLTQAALQMAMEAGVLKPQPVELLAHMVLGALTEGAMYIGRATDRDAARAEVGRSVRTLLEGLRT